MLRWCGLESEDPILYNPKSEGYYGPIEGWAHRRRPLRALEHADG